MNKKKVEIYPDEILIDSENIPKFDTQQFEGRLEKPISQKTFFALFISLGLLFLILFGKTFYLQIISGQALAERSESNNLKKEVIFPARAVISDKNGVRLAWDEADERNYINLSGFSHLLGYLGFPSKSDLEKSDDILSNIKIGKEGVERYYEDVLRGTLGAKLVEVDSHGQTISESVQGPAQSAENFVLSIDSRLQSHFFDLMKAVAKGYEFTGGAGVIIDVQNGEILSLASYPEYDVKDVKSFLNDKTNPLLNRSIAGLYAPGSIIKPLVALAALNEKTISPDKQIFSSGSISVPNPYFPDKKSVYYDWQPNGWVDMRRALAVSSDIYFYEVGGGFEGVKGVGIKKIEEYAKMFGLDAKTGIDLDGEEEGVVPSPELKARVDKNDSIWRVGDTYIASIGQGYFQVTPMEMAVYAAALANNGKILKPHLALGNDASNLEASLPIPENYFQIVKEGMRQAVTEGTATGLYLSDVSVAAKTGTAEIGVAKKYVNSWVIGFFPYENPKYAFAVVMEKGPSGNTVGASYLMRQLLDWMLIYRPEYLK